MATGNRANDVVSDIVRGVREALLKRNVTFDEYRAAVAFLLDCAAKKEVPLWVDLFNTTIVETEGKMFGGSRPSLEGPYLRIRTYSFLKLVALTNRKRSARRRPE